MKENIGYKPSRSQVQKGERVYVSRALQTLQKENSALKTLINSLVKDLHKMAEENRSLHEAVESNESTEDENRLLIVKSEDGGGQQNDENQVSQGNLPGFNRLCKADNLVSNDIRVMADGVYIWKLTCLAALRENCLEYPHACIASEPFLTSRFGYKMRLLLYLNGDDESLNSFISLYWQLMPHDYDPILNWPYQGYLSFTLLPVNRQARPISWSFDASDEEDFVECFQYPIEKPNDVFGISDFAPISLIQSHDYVIEDSCFIKVESRG